MSVPRLPRCYIIYILLTHPSPLCVQLTTCRDPSAVRLTGGGWREGLVGGGGGSKMAIQEILPPLTASCDGLFSFCFVLGFFVFMRALLKLLNAAVCLRSLSFRADLNPAFLK